MDGIHFMVVKVPFLHQQGEQRLEASSNSRRSLASYAKVHMELVNIRIEETTSTIYKEIYPRCPWSLKCPKETHVPQRG